jgi:aminoglycoside 3-N-acetyltransferase
VLLIGAPLDTITLLHHAEHKADLPAKRTHFYSRLMPGPTGPNWVRFEEFDTRNPVSPLLPEECFERMARAYLAAGRGSQGSVGSAQAFLFDGADLVRFGIEWMEAYVKTEKRDRQ